MTAAAVIAFFRSGWGKLVLVLALMLGSGAAGYALHRSEPAVVATSSASDKKASTEDDTRAKAQGPKTIKTDTRKIYRPCTGTQELAEEDTTSVEEDGPSLELSGKHLTSSEDFKSTSSVSVDPVRYKHFSAGVLFGVLNGGGIRLQAGYQVNDWLGIAVSVDPNLTDPKKTAGFVGPQIRF